MGLLDGRRQGGDDLLGELKRGGGPFREIMRKVAFRLTPDEIRAVAAYYASLPPGT